MGDEVDAIADAAKRRDFLDLYGTPGFLVIRNVLKALGLSRYTYNRWRKEDPEFLREVQYVKDDLGDMVEEMMLKRAGVIPTSAKESKSLWRYSDTALGNLHRIYTGTPESQTFNNFAINIAGIPKEALMQLAAPQQAAPQPLPAVEPPLLGDGEACQNLPS